MRKLFKNRSGFSMTEAIVAMAIIVTVSLAALTVNIASYTAKLKAVNFSDAQDLSHNLLECFKASETQEEFEKNAKYALGDEYMFFAIDGKNIECDFNQNQVYEYKYVYGVEGRFKADVYVDLKTGDFAIKATEQAHKNDQGIVSNNNEEIISFTYKKGAK